MSCLLAMIKIAELSNVRRTLVIKVLPFIDDTKENKLHLYQCFKNSEHGTVLCNTWYRFVPSAMSNEAESLVDW